MNSEHYHNYSYQVGGSLREDSPTYIKRKADEDLYRDLCNGEFCYVLYPRQMGKSSLQVKTKQRLKAEGIACVAIDVTSIGINNVTQEQWYYSIATKLSGILPPEIDFELRDWWREQLDLSPIQRLDQLVEKVILKNIHQQVIIFIDEIDSLRDLNFKTDDFFAWVRSNYNKRAENPDYERISYVLIGTVAPGDLIQDKRRTPFNIGSPTEINGFKLHEAQPLEPGLKVKTGNSQTLLTAILSWTGGQPFLTQKLCKLVPDAEESIPENGETAWLDKLVQERIIKNWAAQDEPEHLKTIRDRLLFDEKKVSGLLGIYQQVLQEGEVLAEDNPLQMELRLSGIVIKKEGKLRVANRIYQTIFNQSWIEEQFASLRPYGEAITAWEDSNLRDESRLLRGNTLQEALDWAGNKSLGDEDQRFLSASQTYQRKSQVRQRTLIGIAVSSLLAVSVLVAGIFAQQQRQQAEMDQLILAATSNAINPNIAPNVYKRLPNYLKRADRNKKSGKVDEAITDYQKALLVANRLQEEIEKDPEEYQNIADKQREIESIGRTAELSLVEMIREHRLPELEEQLKQGKFGETISMNLRDRDKRFTGALKVTYNILFGEKSLQADYDRDFILSEGEEKAIPCETLKEIDDLWREFTDNRCGWYGEQDFHQAPNCRELNEETLTRTIIPLPNISIVGKHIKDQCKLIPKTELGRLENISAPNN